MTLEWPAKPAKREAMRVDGRDDLDGRAKCDRGSYDAAPVCLATNHGPLYMLRNCPHRRLKTPGTSDLSAADADIGSRESRKSFRNLDLMKSRASLPQNTCAVLL